MSAGPRPSRLPLGGVHVESPVATVPDPTRGRFQRRDRPTPPMFDVNAPVQDEVMDISVSRTDTVQKAIETMDRCAKGIVLVVNPDRTLLGTITDGDVRRAILEGLELTDSVDSLLRRKQGSPYPTPITARKGVASRELLKIMQRHRIRHLPLVDGGNRVLDLVTMDMLLPEEMDHIRAVVMAGGVGQRLRPLTQDLPKPMLPVGDRPLLEHIVDKIRDSGIRNITITTHYLPEKIRQHFGDGSRHDVNIEYIDEQMPLGTAGALSLMKKADGPILVINGDVLTNLNYRAMYAFHHEHRPSVTIAVRQYEMYVPYGVVECRDMKVTEVKEKPTYSLFVNAGIYIIEPDAMDLVPSERRFDITDLFAAVSRSRLWMAAFPIREYWIDIGRIEDYQKANEDVSSGSLS